MYFYPRSPCGERRSVSIWLLLYRIFLSTLSLRRATISISSPLSFWRNFYPRSPCGERQSWATRARAAQLFLSTPSLRRATILGNPCAGCPAISIHALLAESDGLTTPRQIRCLISIHALLAESDPMRIKLRPVISISIHALLAESDVSKRRLPSSWRRFLSTLSLRRAT